MDEAIDSKVCPFCAETIKAAAKVCRYCRRDLPATNPGANSKTGNGGDGATDGEKQYYLDKFAVFDANNGKFKPTFNWPTLVFGPFWYMYKGIWAKDRTTTGFVPTKDALHSDGILVYPKFYRRVQQWKANKPNAAA